MLGGLSKMLEAGCAVVGGHSVRDAEIKFGYAVTGLGSTPGGFDELRRTAWAMFCC